MRTPEQYHDLLKKAGVFEDPSDFECDDDEGEAEPWDRMINMSDVWWWASADFFTVEMQDMEELYWLNFRYGWCGILWLCSKRRNDLKSEFHHYNRMIEFVEKEEAIKNSHTRTSAYAYDNRGYSLGFQPVRHGIWNKLTEFFQSKKRHPQTVHEK